MKQTEIKIFCDVCRRQIGMRGESVTYSMEKAVKFTLAVYSPYLCSPTGMGGFSENCFEDVCRDCTEKIYSAISSTMEEIRERNDAVHKEES